MNDVQLTLYGDDITTTISGWTEVRITRGIERMPSDFSIAMTEHFPGVDDIVALPGMKCVVTIDGDTVVTGYVDRVINGIGPGQHAVHIVGRGYCQDLVDCSAVWSGGVFQNLDALAIAQHVADPFKIKVVADDDVGDVFPVVCMLPGESPFSLINKICRLRALLCYENELGQLVLARAGSEGDAGGLKEGANVENATFAMSMDQRYSDYTVIQQGAAFMADMIGNQPLDVYTFKDPLVPRFRPKYLVPEYGDANYSVAEAKARWEMNRRLGRGTLLSARVDDWRDANGDLWTPNTLAPLEMPTLKAPDVSWLIGEVTYTLGLEGRHADLLIMPPEAFQPEPVLLSPVDMQVAAALQKN